MQPTRFPKKITQYFLSYFCPPVQGVLGISSSVLIPSQTPPRPVQSTGQSLKMRKCIHGTVRKRIWVEALVLVSVPDLEVFIQLPSSVTPSCSHYPQPRCGWLWQYADKCLTINSLGKKIFVVNFTDIKDV